MIFMVAGAVLRKIVLVSVVATVSCGGASVTQDLRPVVAKKAAFDLACSEEQLKIIELGDSSNANMAGAATTKTFGVEGCGRRASYYASCVKPMMMNEMCTAMQTSAPIASPAASAAPARQPAP